MSLRDNLGRDAATALGVAEAVEVAPDVSIGEAVSLLQAGGGGCVVVTQNGQPIGILTERDILKKVASGELSLDTEIAEIMTSPPEVIDESCSVATVIQRMHGGGFRHMPVVDESRRLKGVVSVKRIVEYLAEHFPSAVFNLPPDPAQKQLAREGA